MLLWFWHHEIPSPTNQAEEQEYPYLVNRNILEEKKYIYKIGAYSSPGERIYIMACCKNIMSMQITAIRGMFE